jgi:hypothetical protein
LHTDKDWNNPLSSEACDFQLQVGAAKYQLKLRALLLPDFREIEEVRYRKWW